MRKSHSQEEIKTIEREAKRICEEYAYMDKMPLEGWMWEFIRRTPTYLDVYSFIKDTFSVGSLMVHTKSKDMKKGPLFESIKKLYKKRKIPLIVDQIITELCCVREACLYDNTGLDVQHFHITGRWGNAFLSDLPCNGVPKPDIRYCDFKDNQKPQIAGLATVTVNTFEELQEHCIFLGDHLAEVLSIFLADHDPESSCMKPTSKLYHDDLEKLFVGYFNDILRNISPTKPEDTVFIGISKQAKKGIVLREIQDILDKHISSADNEINRDSNWKYYLIVYDLFSIKKYTLSKIADIFQKAFPEIQLKKGGKRKIYYTETDIKRLKNRARDLIDGDYKIFLRTPPLPYPSHVIKLMGNKLKVQTINCN